MHKLFTLGYGKSQDHAILEGLPGLIMDVRYSPWSNILAWQKPYMARQLESRYMHVPALGNVNYKNGGPIKLADPEAGIETLALQLEVQPVTLLCCCPKIEGCHRKTVADLAHKELGVKVEHLELIMHQGHVAAIPPSQKGPEMSQLTLF